MAHNIIMGLVFKLINKYKKIKRFDEKYKISLFSANISFYMIIASFSLFNIILLIISKYLESVDSFILDNLIKLLESLEFDNLISFNISSVLFALSLIWSSSKVINAYNKVSDHIYELDKKRNSWYLRFSSFVMFLFLLVIIIFELFVSSFINKILSYFNFSVFLFRVFELLIEFFIIYFIIIFLYIYAPPKKMRYQEVKIGTLIASLMIYLLIIIVVLINSFVSKYLQNINLSDFIFMLISVYLLSLFIINYILILGLIINSKNYKLLIKEIC